MKKRNIDNLESEIQFAQLENFTERFEQSFLKSFKKDLKRTAIFATAIVIVLAVCFFSGSPILSAAGLAIVIGLKGATVFKGFKSKSNFAFRQSSMSSHETPEDRELNKIFEEGKKPIHEKDFHRNEYARRASELAHEPEDRMKYRAALSKQQDKDVKSSSETTSSSVKERILSELDVYLFTYQLPPFNITDNEWNVFFDELEKLLKSKNAVISFYRICSELLRKTCAKALINKTEVITIQTFIDNLYYIRGGYGNLGLGIENISEKEINALKTKLKSKTSSSKIITLDFVK